MFFASYFSSNRLGSIRFAWWVHIRGVKYYDRLSLYSIVLSLFLYFVTLVYIIFLFVLHFCVSLSFPFTLFQYIGVAGVCMLCHGIVPLSNWYNVAASVVVM